MTATHHMDEESIRFLESHIRLTDRIREKIEKHAARYGIRAEICAWYQDWDDFCSDWCAEIGDTKETARERLYRNTGEFLILPDGAGIVRFVMQKEEKFMTRVILKANEGEERYFLDDPEIGEDVMEEEIEGILTVEDEVGYHPCEKSALYDDMNGYVDQVRGEEKYLSDYPRYIVTYFTADGNNSGLAQMVDFGIRKEQILENIKNQKYVEGADYFLMGQLKPLAAGIEKRPCREKAEAAKAETSKDEAALEIDNAIELTWIFAKQDKHISLDVLPYAELKELIADTAKKFEEAHRDTDWNEEDYGEEIQHAADEALALKLWKKFSEVPVSTTSHGIEIAKPWDGFRTGTRWTEILAWFIGTFPGMDFRNMLMETQAVKRPTIADPLKIETPLGTIRVYEATDPNCPGVYIDLGDDPLALVEYTETEADQEGGKIITRVWGDTEKEDYSDRIVHKLRPAGHRG